MPNTPKPKQPKPTAAHRRLELFIGDLMPLWTILDRKPAARGTDWYPKIEYDQQTVVPTPIGSSGATT